MNREERMHRLMGDIDDDLVVDAARKPIRKAVWIPAVAAAACVALTVGLWQGGVFDPAEIPVEPSEGVAVTEPTEEAAVTEPSEEVATGTTEPSEKTESTKTTKPSKTTESGKTTKSTKSSKSTKSTESTKTTVTTIDGKMVVFADSQISISETIPYDGYLHGTLQEKMEQYKGQDVLYAVVVEVPLLDRDIYEFEHPSNPLPKEEWYSEDQMYSQEFTDAYFNRIFEQGAEKLKEITGKELIPVSAEDKYWGIYASDEYTFLMELTAEEINELDKCDCFFIRLRHPDGDGKILVSE